MLDTTVDAMKQAASRSPVPPAAARFRGVDAALLLLVMVSGVAVGLALHLPPATSVPAAGQATHPTLVVADPRTLVTQPGDLPAVYSIASDAQAADPGQTHPKQRYAVTISRSDLPDYAAQAAVNSYASEEEARVALRTLLGVGQFGSELPMHDSLGDEAHLFAARAGDRSLVIGSVLWRDRNVIAYVFVYNPYSAQVPADVLERLARANAYDDTMGFAVPVERRIKDG